MKYLAKINAFYAVLLAVICFSSAAGTRVSAQEPTVPSGGRSISVVSTQGQAGTQVTVSIELDSQGDEIAASFSLSFDPAIFSNPVITRGFDAPLGSNLSFNLSQAPQGRVGILIDSTVPFQNSPPNRQMMTIQLDVNPGAPGTVSPINFVTTPTPISVSNIAGALLPTVFQVGTVTVTPANVSLVTIGGRVSTPSGQNLRNAVVSLVDSNGVRRIATTSSFGLYSFDNVSTGQVYTLTVSSKRYRFSPIITNITAATNDLNLVGLE